MTFAYSDQDRDGAQRFQGGCGKVRQEQHETRGNAGEKPASGRRRWELTSGSSKTGNAINLSNIFIAAIRQEAEHNKFKEGIEHFNKDQLSKTSTVEKNTLPTKEVIEQEKKA